MAQIREMSLRRKAEVFSTSCHVSSARDDEPISILGLVGGFSPRCTIELRGECLPCDHAVVYILFYYFVELDTM